MELSEVRGAEENRVMKETMNEKDFIELMFYNLYPRIKRVGSRRRGHPLSGKPS